MWGPMEIHNNPRIVNDNFNGSYFILIALYLVKEGIDIDTVFSLIIFNFSLLKLPKQY